MFLCPFGTFLLQIQKILKSLLDYILFQNVYTCYFSPIVFFDFNFFPLSSTFALLSVSFIVSCYFLIY